MCGGSNRRSALLGLIAVLSALYHAGSITPCVVLCFSVCILLQLQPVLILIYWGAAGPIRGAARVPVETIESTEVGAASPVQGQVLWLRLHASYQEAHALHSCFGAS